MQQQQQMNGQMMNGFNGQMQPQMQQQQMQQPTPLNSTNDLWGAIAEVNQTTQQQQQAELQKQKEAEAAAAAKRAAEQKKNQPFSDPFASLISEDSGVQASDEITPQKPVQQQHPQQIQQQSRQNSMMGS